MSAISDRVRSLSRMPMRGEIKASRPVSPSVELLKHSLEIAGVNRKTFVRETGLSYEYVSRIFNSKVKFPTVRETLERFAEVARIDPMDFNEYQQLVDALPDSTRKIWARMQELALSRQEFANRVEISRTYLYEILRGDVPFPRNPEVIEKISAAIDIPPETFNEYLAPVEDWGDRNPLAIEQVFFSLLVSKLLHARGYCKDASPAVRLDDAFLAVFPADDAFDPAIRKVFTAMAKKGLSFRQLVQMTDCQEADLRELFQAKAKPAEKPEVYAALKTALKLR